MGPRKIIIDTDPGVDDVLAMLLAFSASPEELEILLISVTYGNIDVQNCLRNVVSLFYHIEKEIKWREANGNDGGFKTLRQTKPIVAVGPEHPLMDEMLMADFFHGRDGLGGIHESHPHLTPNDTWQQLFKTAQNSEIPEASAIATEMKRDDRLFIASKQQAHKEILRLLGETEPDTITIVAIGPLTNLAMAAAEDPETFLRVHEVVVMGGNINEPGNMSPVAEFNTFADTVAAARVYALTSPNPRSTMPPHPPVPSGLKEGSHPPPFLRPYPEQLTKRLKLTLFPLDITERHELTRGQYRKAVEPLLAKKSPLAEWTMAFLNSTFNKIETLQHGINGDNVGLQLHDPLCIGYCMASDETLKNWEIIENEDIRVETSGQWTRGMCVVDKRTRAKREDDEMGEVAGDSGNWLNRKAGNRMRRAIRSPGQEHGAFGTELLHRIFAQ
ncbi:hypothetical protein M433DRAFT_94343 [Acidomyces richmondensis BFW]|nr:MAG: hypothetical protein FE78DRAFT_110457 [Acidomyces sp. 'richmondensis']KYG42976.1 hypothetical protein M433DRAFT_94343 [Acidomyces richmondensis BFW]